MSSLRPRQVRPSGHTLVLTAPARDAIEWHARQGYPHEVVGILAGAPGRVEVVQPLDNLDAERPGDRYRVDGLALMRAEQALERQGLAIIGYYHSHPDHPAMYSDTDRDLALPNMAYLITAVAGGQPPTIVGHRCWRLAEDRSEMTEDTLVLPDR
ncbi:MAG: M67 family peptidase [Deltaproteobacteria bacterium]|nr:MAG: M67 family peptidase [Deltaproteobacteria bacterium]